MGVGLKLISSQKEFDSMFVHRREKYELKPGQFLLVVVRHGKCGSNDANVFGGRTIDTDVTIVGIEQSQNTGRYLRTKIDRIDSVHTSTMKRTLQTAEEILKVFPESHPTFTTAVGHELEERFVDQFEGCSLDEYKTVNVHDKVMSASSATFAEKMAFKPEEKIESYAEVWERIKSYILKYTKDHPGETGLVVLDSGAFRSILWMLGAQLDFYVRYDESKPDYGSAMIISVEGEEMTLLEAWNVNILTPSLPSR